MKRAIDKNLKNAKMVDGEFHPLRINIWHQA
ncbi:hypothetical protein BC643_0597 [Mangrovibacterium diazotrophicum]|uniref:Uncharacterized protein n=1 Tax=Mangrovibacterium diazotrophicum TaxID=1261403 RepID=A0A419W472_9BACT|nr:hypothetical protein BC643_0597 [Mangrovibacterium diazotrophicum]